MLLQKYKESAIPLRPWDTRAVFITISNSFATIANGNKEGEFSFPFEQYHFISSSFFGSYDDTQFTRRSVYSCGQQILGIGLADTESIPFAEIVLPQQIFNYYD